jgi:hypothetical protein
MKNKCQLCGIECELTKHHLVPQLKLKNKYKSLKDDSSNILWICRSCHDQIHTTFSENDLRDNYNTKEKLIEHEGFKKFLAWKVKHPDFKGHSKMSKERKLKRK